MHQIVFNEISAAEFSAIPKGDQLNLMAGFQVNDDCLANPTANKHFGLVEREGKKIYRFRFQDYRLYFTTEIDDGDVSLIVQRVLHANSLKDFLFRSSMGSATEDQKLAKSGSFWTLIEEGEKAERQ